MRPLRSTPVPAASGAFAEVSSWCSGPGHCRSQQLDRPLTGVGSYHARMLTRADDLAKLTVLDDSGKSIELGTLWREHDAVLVFVRHFG